MDASQVTDNNNGYLWVCCSFVSFLSTNFALGYLIPSNAKKSPHHMWKWKNIANSLLHSSITGIWAMVCFLQIPAMKDDLINNYSVSAQGVISLSVGYFIYDLFDMAVHDAKRSSGLLIHHCLVVSCFGLSVCTNYYQGYSLVALLVEVNSIFLHFRQLMLLYGIDKSSVTYQVNGMLNLATFVIFRVFTMGGMLHWLLTHRADLSTTVFGLGVFSLIVIMGMNFQLLYRVWKSDYKKTSQRKGREIPEKIGKPLQPHQLQDHHETQPNGEREIRNPQDVTKSSLTTKVSSPILDDDSKIVNTNGKFLKCE